MGDQSCRHDWTIVNLRNGYLVTEGCPHCGRRACFFTLEDHPHKDSYVDGEHTWRFLGNSQAFKFDLKCRRCGKEVNLESVMGLMLCLDCRDDCVAAATGKELGGEGSWVYVALCADTSHASEECIGTDETRALTEYFNSRIKTPGKKVVFVPCKLRKGIDTCQGEIIADAGLKELY